MTPGPDMINTILLIAKYMACKRSRQVDITSRKPLNIYQHIVITSLACIYRNAATLGQVLYSWLDSSSILWVLNMQIFFMPNFQKKEENLKY